MGFVALLQETWVFAMCLIVKYITSIVCITSIFFLTYLRKKHNTDIIGEWQICHMLWCDTGEDNTNGEFTCTYWYGINWSVISLLIIWKEL